MANNAEINIRIRAIDNASNVINKVEKSSGKLKKSFGDFAKEIPGVGSALSLITNPAVLAGAAIAGIAVNAKQWIGLASDINETTSKVGVIFGEGAEEIEEFADTAATALGQSKKQAMDAAATFATFGKAAGLSGEKLVDFSIDLTGLSADLASFSNTSPEEAITAIGAALRGESEPIRRYGVLLDDATLRQKALEMGIVDTIKNALTPQQRSLAAYQVILDQTTDAQGDFSRTSDGLANQQKILTAQVENLKTELGKGLTPAAIAATRALNNMISSTNIARDRNELYREALELNIITEREWAQWIEKRNPLHKDTAEITEELTRRLEEYETQANATKDIELIRAGVMKTSLIPTTEDYTEATKNAAYAIYDVSEAALGKAALDALNLAYEQGTISTADYEKKLSLLLVGMLNMDPQAANTTIKMNDLKQQLAEGKITTEQYIEKVYGLYNAMKSLDGTRATTYVNVVEEGTTMYRGKDKGGYASGGDFIVPPGYPNDTYPINVTSGERVIVQTPAQQTTNNYWTMNNNMAGGVVNPVESFAMMRALAS